MVETNHGSWHVRVFQGSFRCQPAPFSSIYFRCFGAGFVPRGGKFIDQGFGQYSEVGRTRDESCFGGTGSES